MATTAQYNIENQEHYRHPEFVRVGERYLSMINTLSSATQRAQIELADLEKEEAEWQAQVLTSGLALRRVEDALGAAQQSALGQSWTLAGPQNESGSSAGGLNGLTGAAGADGSALQVAASEREGLLGLLGMGSVDGSNGNSNGNSNGSINGGGDLNGSVATKKITDNKKSAAKKKAAARRRR
jgi:hypothetical protein